MNRVSQIALSLYRSRYGLAWLVLALGVTASMLVWDQMRRSERRAGEARFTVRSEEAVHAVKLRFTQYESVLRGAQGLFAASATVDRETWDRYVERLKISELFPGISALTYSERVPAARREIYERRMREQGFTNYRIETHASAEEYFPVVFDSHAQGPSRIGYDIFSEPVRRQALERARDSAEPALTARIVQSNDTGADAPASAAMVLPVYARGATVDTREARRDALQGYLGVVFRIQDLMNQVLGGSLQGLRLQIYDGNEARPPALIYDSAAAAERTPSQSPLRLTRPMQIAGHAWQIQVAAQPDFFAGQVSRSTMYLVVGLLVTLLLAAIVRALRRSEERARTLADRMVEERRAADEQCHLMVDSVSDHGIFMLNPQGCVSSWNLGAARIKGYASEEILGQHFSVFYEAEDRASGLPQRILQAASESGRYVGEGWRVRKDGSRFWASVTLTAIRDEKGELSGFSKVTRDLTERKRAEELVQHVAYHDALTDLPNRHLLIDRLSMGIKQARRTRTSIGVLMIDLDHFKRINDSLGHSVGDQVLLQVTERLNASVRVTDTVARLGGDEFVVVLPETGSRDAIAKVACNLLEVLSQVIHVGPHDFHVTPSLGLCRYPEDGEDPSALLKHADIAMYHAKAMGRNNYQWFEPYMVQHSASRLEMENDMRQALERDEFLLYYQPLVSLSERRIVGMEALIRWPHPRQGLILPDRFIPLAEETGLIVPLGAWVLRRACTETQRMREECGQNLNIAVNVSMRQFQQPDFLRTLEDALATSGLPPGALTLEITESILAQDPNQAIRLLNEIRDLGVGVSVDDFGTGYSSLSYVTRFPIAKLKIDRSFVSSIATGSTGDTITGTIISMAHSLNLKVVAEGVENQEQLRFLDARACDEGQGFLFSPALDAASFLRLAQSSARTH